MAMKDKWPMENGRKMQEEHSKKLPGDPSIAKPCLDKPSSGEGPASEVRLIPEDGSIPRGSPGRLSRKSTFGGFQVSPATHRLAGAGMALAAYALGLGGAGYFLDRLFGWKIPFLGIAGVLIGFILGMIRLIRLAEQIDES